jgi:hypothetical protein
MKDDSTVRNELAEAIDTIESGYEFLLAYAAQGRHTDRDAPTAQSPRNRIEAMAGAMQALPVLARRLAESISAVNRDECAPFFDALDRDAAVSVAAARLVLSRPDLSSQLIDNLNASIHLRALLTDIFLIDEIVKK